MSLYLRWCIGLWRAAFYLCLTAIFVLALGPSEAQVISTGWDKANHVLAFMALGLLIKQAHSVSTFTACLVLLAVGGVIEALQSMLPNRYAEWNDLLADGLGIVLGLIVADVVRRIRVLRGALKENLSSRNANT